MSYSQNHQDITRALNEHYNNGTLDSIQVKIWMANNHFNFETLKTFYVIQDTLIDSTGDYSIGFTVLDPFMEYHNRKIGEWKGYYSNGQLKFIGKYAMGATTTCQFAGPTISGYSFKRGEWIYFYVNGQIEAKGTYLPYTKSYNHNCGEDAHYVSYPDSNWHYWNENGIEIKKPKDY